MKLTYTHKSVDTYNTTPKARKIRKLSSSVVNFDQLPDSAQIDLQDLMMLASCCRATIYNWIAAGILPIPKKLGPTRNYWRAGDVRKALSL